MKTKYIKSMGNADFVHSFLALSVLMHLHENDAIMLEVNVMHEPKASALHSLRAL